MSRRLGEVLIASGRLTEPQLHQALTAQLVFGGHLGTSLLEMGLIDERSLGETLSQISRVGYAEPDSLSGVPYSVVRSLPAGLVQKHKVVPLRLEGRVLHLAMIDPRNILAIDEISFVTGYRIVPWVSPEFRILEALEKYYDVARAPRFVSLAREMSRLPSPRHRLKPETSDQPVPDEEARPHQAGALRASTAAVGSAPESAPIDGHAADRPQGPVEAGPDPWEAYGYGRSWQEVAEAIDGSANPGPVEAGEIEEADTRPHPKTSAQEAAVSMLTTSRRLAEASNVEEVIEGTLSYASARLARTLFFVVRGGHAVAWGGKGWSVAEPSLRQIAIRLGAEPSLLALVTPGAGHYLGSLQSIMGWAERFYQQLQARPPRTALVIPIRLKGREVAFLYGDDGAKEIQAIDLPSMIALSSRAGFALQIMILRNKILAS